MNNRIKFLVYPFHINEEKQNIELHEIYTFRSWKESQKARKSQEAIMAYRWDFLDTLDLVIIII